MASSVQGGEEKEKYKMMKKRALGSGIGVTFVNSGDLENRREKSALKVGNF